MTDQLSNNIQIRAYSSDGYEITLLMTGTLADVTKKLSDVRAAGFLAFQPEMTGGERQMIASVMRHVTDSGTDVIGAYPPWKYEGKYGEFKFASIYLDSPEDVAQFEAQSGLKLTEIPLSDGEVGVRRKYGKTLPKEIAVKRIFEMIRFPDGTSDDGKPRYRYEYAAPLPVVKRWTEADAKAFARRWEPDNLTTEDLLKALKVSRFGEWPGTVEQANEAVTAYIKAAMDSKPAQPKATTDLSTKPPTRLIDCPVSLLEPGDVIYQTYRDGNGNPAETRYEVVEYWGKVGNGYSLKLKKAGSDKVESFHWTTTMHTLCAGPKVDMVARNPELITGAKQIGGNPQWNGQTASLARV
jgi:hypothetical protein